jgi:uncharacterized membrane protein
LSATPRPSGTLKWHPPFPGFVVDVIVLFRFLHILGVAFFLGGIGTQAAWKVFSDRSRSARDAAAVHDKLVRVDRLFTGPSALLIFVTGYVSHRILQETRIAEAGWVFWGLVLMFIALGLWYFGMRPLELKMADAAEDAADRGENLGRDYARLSGTWFTFWAAVTGLIVIVAMMMVFRWPAGPVF